MVVVMVLRLLFYCCCVRAARGYSSDGKTCLPDAVPEDERRNITYNGVSMPIGIAVGDWTSSRLVSEIYAILVSDVLGYHWVQKHTGNGLASLHWVLGCPHVPAANFSECSLTTRHHAAFEIWGHQSKLPKFLQLLAEMGEEHAARFLGSAGYWGREGLFVMEQAREKCQAGSGLHLNYYGNYNATWFAPENCSATVGDVNFSLLSTCADSVNIGFPDSGQQYLDATGDADGVELVGGIPMLKCWQGKWWIAPACRSNPYRCVASVTGGNGWGTYFMSQQAAFHNMPIALATASSWDNYVDINSELKSHMYWYTPDASFALLKPMLVEFPSYSAAEYRAAIYRTMPERVRLEKWAAAGFEAADDRAFGLARNLQISDSDMSKLVVLHLELASGEDFTNTYLSACTWLKANPDVWAEWVPDQTVCPVGKGIVNLHGEFVTDRSTAVDCTTCSAGRASVKAGATRVCALCEPGFFQNILGSPECSVCEPGSISSIFGAHGCELCSLGEYVNSSGKTACTRCGSGTGQEEMWTTSRDVILNNETQVIQVLGADSESFCACQTGSLLWNGRCKLCMEGLTCPGSNRFAILPGYFSASAAPGEVFKCRDRQVCPGGMPGTCADGRDVSSACVKCQEGFADTETGACRLCDGMDYSVLSIIFLGVVMGVTILHFALMQDDRKQPRSLMVVLLGFIQFVTMVQMMAVLRRFEISWREPFASVLRLIEVLSIDIDMINTDCLGQPSPVVSFLIRCLFIPMLMLVALLVHLCYLIISRSKTFKLAYLTRTMGSIMIVFFIILFSMLLSPFQCEEHPNGLWTVRRYGNVFCGGQGEQLQMSLIGILACLMPLAFISICLWLVLVELPRRLARSDAAFLNSCSFLFKRFAPGAEVFSVVFLLRNSLLTMCPLITTKSGRLVSMSIILYASIAMVAFYKPWRFMINNVLDMILMVAMLVILDMGATAISEEDPQTTVVVVMFFVLLMLAAVLFTLLSGLYRFVRQLHHKHFRFFLCHQKNAAGSMARLLKMKLEQSLPGTKTFIDCDDLNDLTRLFSYVGQDTETFLIMATPAVLTRKWCVGEMVTAWRRNVNTLILAWPDFVKPNDEYIEKYANVVPDIQELTKFGISLKDVLDTFRWLNKVDTTAFPKHLTYDSVSVMVSSLAKLSVWTYTSQAAVETDCPILVDPENSEAMACAMVLSTMLKARLLGTHVQTPHILSPGSHVSKGTETALLICSENCFKSEHIQSWLIQACKIPKCCMVPIIAEDAFMIPSACFFDDLNSKVLNKDEVKLYGIAIRALFQEIAVVFVPQNYSSTLDDLELRAKQTALRLSAKMAPLADKARILAQTMMTVPQILSNTALSALSDGTPDSLSTHDESDHGPLESKSF